MGRRRARGRTGLSLVIQPVENLVGGVEDDTATEASVVKENLFLSRKVSLLDLLR